jgi:hypothetical protein
VERFKALVAGMPGPVPSAVIIPEAFDLFIKQEDTIIDVVDMYVDYAVGEPAVAGMDVFTMLDYCAGEDFYGMHHYPKLETHVLAVGQKLLHRNPASLPCMCPCAGC